MASLRKRGEKWQARVHRKNCEPIVKTFANKSDATKWARNIESELDLGTYAPKKPMPRLLDVIDRYVAEITPTKKGKSQERYRANQIRRTPMAELQLDKVTSGVTARYRDHRLNAVSANTVRLELAFLSVVFEQCRKEWGLTLRNPVRQVRMPKPGKPRQRRLEAGEEEVLMAACRASGAHYLHAFVVLAIETGMRFGELAGVTWKNVDMDNRTIFLPDTKNGQSRTIPLSTRAVCVIQGLTRGGESSMFTCSPGSIRSAYLFAVKKANAASGGQLLQGLRFHDLRHEAITRLFERGLNPIEVGMISGHKTLAMLQRYTHISPATLINKLG